MKLENITDVFFDLDHTLWDFERNSAMAFEKVLLKNEIAVGLSDFLEVYEPINERYWDLYRAEKIQQKELRYIRFHKTFTKLGMALSDKAIEKLSEDYIHHLPDASHLFPGVMETLKYLHPKYNLHIITDGFLNVQERKLSNSAITDFFKTITTSDCANAKKPSAVIFEHALKEADCKVENSVMIGDNLYADIRGALDFGMQAVYFSQNKDHNGLTIDSHLQLKELL